MTVGWLTRCLTNILCLIQRKGGFQMDGNINFLLEIPMCVDCVGKALHRHGSSYLSSSKISLVKMLFSLEVKSLNIYRPCRFPGLSPPVPAQSGFHPVTS